MGACPDRQMIWLYLDEELPSPWKEKLEGHLRRCPECAGLLDGYRELSARIGADAPAAELSGETADSSVAGERVWRRLEGTLAMPVSPSILRRKVSMPLPMVAGIAAAAVLVAGLALNLGGRPDSPPELSAALGETDAVLPEEGIFLVGDLPDMALGTDFEVQAEDIQSVIEYLVTRDGADTEVMRLPESRRFVSNGKPTLVRSSDYSRQMASWTQEGGGRN